MNGGVSASVPINVPYPSPSLRVATGLLVFLAACGGGLSAANVAAPAPPTAEQAQWIASAIGGTPDFSVVARPLAARSDTYWGPLIARLLQTRDGRGDFISRMSGSMVLSSQQIDMHFATRDPILGRGRDSKDDGRGVDWIGFIYGMAPVDPLTLRSGNGTPLFAPPVRLAPSGVLMYMPDQRYAREFGDFSPTLFITGNGTCVVTDQRSAPRAHGMLSAANFAPPPLAAGPDTLGGVRAAVTSMRFLNAKTGDRTAITQGMTAAAIGIRGGQNGAIESYGDYATVDDAKRGYSALQESCARRKNECLIDPSYVTDAKAEREGSRVVVTLSLSEKLLRSLQNQVD